jgi:glycosyltransferase involved in cell wall biosynthesis
VPTCWLKAIPASKFSITSQRLFPDFAAGPSKIRAALQSSQTAIESAFSLLSIVFDKLEMKSVKVSVIIPNYNRAAIVGETIENMLRQSLAPYEVIVVDDGSTDDSVEVIRSFGDRVHLLQQPNQGPGAARNKGLKMASGDFIQLMDSDDLFSLNKLESQAEMLISQQADIVYGPWAKVFIENSALSLQDVVLQQHPISHIQSAIEHFLSGWSVVLQQCLIRRSLIQKVGFYSTDMRTCDDSDFFLRMLLENPVIAFCDRSLTLYRANDYGKVTGSGATNKNRVEDWGRFLVSAWTNISCQHLKISISAQHHYFVEVWRTLQILQQLNSDEQQLVVSLEKILQQQRQFRGALRLYSRIFDIQKGFQQRIKGHRWPWAYQTGELVEHQKQLIEQLGFRIEYA